MKDEQFIAEAKRAGIEVSPVSGEQVAELVRKVYDSPPEVVARARAALADGVKGARAK